MNESETKKRNIFNMCLINARSLVFKLPSLLECLIEMETDVCIITETWLGKNAKIEQELEDFENQNQLLFIRRDRQDGRRGGGVAICYKTASIDMSRVKLPPTKYEIVAAVGRRTGQRRKIVVLAAYLPPAMKANQVRRCLKDVNDSLVHIKQKYVDPYIAVGGDFNRLDIRSGLADHAEIQVLKTGPTRGGSVLDILATNFNDLAYEIGTTEPIRSETDVPTDHLTVYACFKMSRVPQYKIESYGYYHESVEGNRRFGSWLAQQNWEQVLTAQSVDEKTAALHSLFEIGTEQSYEWKVRKKKTSEPVWMTEGVRDMIRRRRKLFKKIRRRGNWQSLKDRISKIVDERKRVNNEQIIKQFTENKNPRNFHRAVKRLLGENSPPQCCLLYTSPSPRDRQKSRMPSSA